MPEETNQNLTPVQQRPASNMGIPFAIVVGFAFIAIATYFSGGKGTPAAVNTAPTPEPEKAIELSPVTEKDFIRGNPNAPITIVEYSDYDCPFCKNFHDTMKLIMDDYGVPVS